MRVEFYGCRAGRDQFLCKYMMRSNSSIIIVALWIINHRILLSSYQYKIFNFALTARVCFCFFLWAWSVLYYYWVSVLCSYFGGKWGFLFIYLSMYCILTILLTLQWLFQIRAMFRWEWKTVGSPRECSRHPPCITITTVPGVPGFRPGTMAPSGEAGSQSTATLISGCRLTQESYPE